MNRLLTRSEIMALTTLITDVMRLNLVEIPKEFVDCSQDPPVTTTLGGLVQALMGEEIDPDPARGIPQTRVFASSIYGANTKKGIVTLTIGEHVTQMSPREARDVALTMLEAAEAAQTDEFIMHWLSEKVGVDENRAGQILMDMRLYRVAQQVAREAGFSEPGQK